MREEGQIRTRLFGRNAETVIEWLLESGEIKCERALRTIKHSDCIS